MTPTSPVSVEIGNISTGNPTVSVQASVSEILALSSWAQPDNTELEFSALVQTDDTIVGGAVYGITPRTVAGTLLDGALTFDGGTVPPTRIRIQNSGATVNINDNSALSLATYFGAGGDGNDLTFHFQTLEGLASFGVSDAGVLGTSGLNFVNFNIPAADQNLFNNLTGGERFILAATRLIANVGVGVGIGNLSTGNPTVVFSVTTVLDPVPVQIGNLSTGNPTASVSATVINTNVAADIGILSTGAPTLSVSVAVRNANVEADIGNISTGDPTVSVSASVITANVPAEIGNLSTGSPTVTVEVIPISIDFDAIEVEIGNHVNRRSDCNSTGNSGRNTGVVNMDTTCQYGVGVFRSCPDRCNYYKR